MAHETAPDNLPVLSMPLLTEMAERLKVLAHPHRLKIVEILALCSEAPVHRIRELARLPQATTSQHLGLMRRAGIIRASRRGKEVWYGIADPDCKTILNCIRTKGTQR